MEKNNKHNKIYKNINIIQNVVDEIIDMWLRDWEAWFFHWSAYMNEYWSW